MGPQKGRLISEIQRLYALAQKQQDNEDVLGDPLSHGESLDAEFLPIVDDLYRRLGSDSISVVTDRHEEEDRLMLDMVEKAGMRQCAAKLRHSFDKLEHWYS